MLLFSLMFMALPVKAASVPSSTPTATIMSFNAKYFLKRDAQKVPSMDVEEEIVVLYNSASTHGIELALAQSYKGQPYNLKVTSVSSTAPSGGKYSTYQSNGSLVLRIGDSNKSVSGLQTYKIKFSLRNPIAFFKDHDEFFWDVNGTQWQQPFKVISGQLYIPSDLASQLKTGQYCYVGAQGSKSQDCSISRTQENGDTVIKALALNQPVGSNLSLVAAFKSGTFAKDQAAVRHNQLMLLLKAFLILGLPLIVFIFEFILWYKKGRDAKGRGTIVPQYTPPPGLNSLLSDAIINEGMSNKAVSAQIIELAIRGYILMTEKMTSGTFGIGKESDYNLRILRPINDLTAQEQAVIGVFFDKTEVGETVSLKELQKTRVAAYSKLSDSVEKQISADGYFKKGSKSRGNWMVSLSLLIFIIIFVVGSIVGTGMNNILPLSLGVLLSLGVTIFFGHIMAARTAKGTATLEYLKGLKMYMELAEADRIKFLQSPEGIRQWGDQSNPVNKVHLFEKLLPYAIIFGLEKQWSKQFEGIYTQAPSWYGGNMNNFSTAYLATSIASFSSFSQSSFASPTSSSSSGFGGGGFSGGGGGSVGGGTW